MRTTATTFNDTTRRFICKQFQRRRSRSRQNSQQTSKYPRLRSQRRVPITTKAHNSHTKTCMPIRQGPIKQSIQQLCQDSNERLTRRIQSLRSFNQLTRVTIHRHSCQSLRTITQRHRQCKQQNNHHFHRAITHNSRTPHRQLLQTCSLFRPQGRQISCNRMQRTKKNLCRSIQKTKQNSHHLHHRCSTSNQNFRPLQPNLQQRCHPITRVYRFTRTTRNSTP